jgi:hypothetical protein
VIWRATARLRRGATPASRVPVAAARHRLAELEDAGWTPKAIAAAAGLAPSTITRIGKPRTGAMSNIVERALLGVEP